MASEMNQLTLKASNGTFSFQMKDATARQMAQNALDAIENASGGSDSSGGECNVQRIESDSNNYVYLRDLASGVYILYGYFRPYNGASSRLAFENVLVNVVADATESHILALTTVNSKVDFITIAVDSTQESGYAYTRTNISMVDLHGLIARVEALEATAIARIDTITLLAANWQTLEDEKHTQEFTIPTVTENTYVSHAIDEDTAAILQDKMISLSTKNDGGKVVVTATGTKPTLDYTIQIKLEEVTWI